MKVSVIIPTYKRADILPRAIESVVQQTYSNIEIVVVSDGIDEPTNNAMNRYINNPNVRYYYYEENKGGNYARNFGIDKATGEYIAFLDDDDVWVKDKLEKQMKVFENNQIGLVYCGKEHRYIDENVSYISSATQQGDLSDEIFKLNYIGSTSSVVVKKAVLDEVGDLDESLPSMQDYDLWIRICQVTLVGAVNEPLLIYINESANNQISVNIEKREQAFSKLMDKYKDYFKKDTNLQKVFEENNLKSLIRMAQRNSDRHILLKYLKIYINKNTSLRSMFFAFTALLPYPLALKFRTIIN